MQEWQSLTVVEFLDLLGPGLVEEVVQLPPPVALLRAQVDDEQASQTHSVMSFKVVGQ
jgi:hypothetical protein